MNKSRESLLVTKLRSGPAKRTTNPLSLEPNSMDTVDYNDSVDPALLWLILTEKINMMGADIF